MEYLDTLNAAQRQVVENSAGPMLVVAGAGSGKTRVLTMRIAYLIEHGVKPYNILALTFTNKAAREMKERIAKIVGDDVARQLWMGTFHSIFAKILRFEAQALGFSSDFSIYDTQDSKSLIRSILKSMSLDEKEYKLSSVLSAISAAKNELITPQGYASNTNYMLRDKSAGRPATAEIYAKYVQGCRKANALDFDDLLLYTNVLFRDHPDVLEKYQQKFQHVLVDEYQDTNHSQYVIVKRLAELTHNICVVGDDAQSIYSFRGARIENILRFANDYPDCKTFKLERNYRSTKNIVGAANGVIAHNLNRLPKTVYSDNDEGDKVLVISTMSDIEEASVVCKNIVKQVRSGGHSASEFAILYRTNAQSRVFEEEMRRSGIRYKIYGGQAFYQRKEIKDLLAYIRLASNPQDNESFKRIINYPMRGIGNLTVSKLEFIAANENITLWETLNETTLGKYGLSGATAGKLMTFARMIEKFINDAKELDAYNLAAEIVTRSGMQQDLVAGKKDPEGEERYENVQEMLNGIKEFCERMVEQGDSDAIDAYLAEVALITDQDVNDGGEEFVTLMTIHSSKGLEFDSVFIVGVEEDIFPGQQSMASAHQIEEERRLFYVALTRARVRAVVSYAQSRFQYGKRIPSRPSRFISELPSEFVDKPEVVASKFSSQRAWSSPEQRMLFSHRTEKSYQPKYQQHRNLTPVEKKEPNSTFHIDAPADEVTHNGSTYRVGTRIVHDTFGRGVVNRIEGRGADAKLIISFEHLAGEKHLLVKFARIKAL